MAGMRSRDFIFIFKKNSLAQHVQRCKFELFDKFEEKRKLEPFPAWRKMVARGQNNLSFHAGTQVKRGGNGCQRAE